MRITKQIRDVITFKALAHKFDALYEQEKQMEHDLAMQLYHSVFSLQELSILENVPKKWLRMDSCLRFNCLGYDLTLRVNQPVPVPYATHCSRLGSVDDVLAGRAQEHAHKKQELREKQNKARIVLQETLNKVRTIKELQKLWPEGVEFYKDYLSVAKGNLPAVTFDSINDMLK